MKYEKLLNMLNQSLQPYDYERYRAVNPNLTVRMYEYLRENQCEWKILCGLRVKIRWENEILEEVKSRKGGEGYKLTTFYLNRFTPEEYLASNIW